MVKGISLIPAAGRSRFHDDGLPGSIARTRLAPYSARDLHSISPRILKQGATIPDPDLGQESRVDPA